MPGRATNGEGGSRKASAALVVAPFPDAIPPTASADPTITGTALVGETLTCNPGSWQGDPAFSYQWLRNGAPIATATEPTYALGASDKGTAIQCALTASNAGGTRLLYSASSLIGAQPPSASADPSVSGTPAVGQTLACAPGIWFNSPTFSYQWLRNGAPIGAATAATYIVAAADEGKILQCSVSAANADALANAVSHGVVIPPGPGTAPPHSR